MVEIMVISVVEGLAWSLAITGYFVLAWKLGGNRRRIFRSVGVTLKRLTGGIRE